MITHWDNVLYDYKVGTNIAETKPEDKMDGLKSPSSPSPQLLCLLRNKLKTCLVTLFVAAGL